MTEVKVVKVKSLVKLRWRTRFRLWWLDRRKTPLQRELEAEFNRRMDEALLFGRPHGE